MSDPHLTAPTQLVEREKARFACRRWGNATSGRAIASAPITTRQTRPS